jgi:signal transduction histidine kinase
LKDVHEELEFQTKVLMHDIRSPIGAAGGALALVRRRIVESDSSELVQLAEDNIRRAEDMIEVLKQVQEVGRIDDMTEELQFRDLLNEVLAELEADIDRKTIEVAIDLEAERLIAVRRNLLIILRNLIRNAVTYVPGEGKGRIVVRLQRRGEVEINWLLSVYDNGPGIPPEHQPVVFDMFRKVPGRQSVGMGVGLGLVRKVARESGGDAGVKSDGRSGSEFWVSWPDGTRV